jgi:hypothetical protein
MHIGLHVKYRYARQIVIKIGFCRQIFEIYSDIKFNENPSSGSRVVLCSQVEGRKDGQTDMTELTLAFRNFANAHKMVLK